MSFLCHQDADIVNYFVVGSRETISRVLDAATANGMFGRKYSWYALSKVRLRHLLLKRYRSI